MAGKPQRRVWHATCAAALRAGKSPSDAARAVVAQHPEVTFHAARFHATRLKQRDDTRGMETSTPDTIASPLTATPLTLAQLLQTFGLDADAWVVIECTPNVWQVGAKHPETGEILTAPLYQIKARLKPKVAPADAALAEKLLADIRAERSVSRVVTHRTLPAPDARHMLEVSAFDLHFGKLSWREEAGEDYDIGIARQCFESAIEDLIAKASGFALQRILLPIGNDLLQTDNLAGTTTSGTSVDTDSRYHKAFRAARSALSWAIHRLSGLAPVLVIVVPGNHDRLTAFHMGEVLAAEFAADPSVTVDNSPKLRKYVTFGVTLLGFTHGSEEKHADLPLIMAREEADAWSHATHYEWHVGHLHKAKETRYTAGDSFNGVRVRILPSLCAADAWHYQKGFVGERRSAEAYLWSFTTGYAGHLSTSILPAKAA